jgi:hypothetical protein
VKAIPQNGLSARLRGPEGLVITRRVKRKVLRMCWELRNKLWTDHFKKPQISGVLEREHCTGPRPVKERGQGQSGHGLFGRGDRSDPERLAAGENAVSGGWQHASPELGKQGLIQFGRLSESRWGRGGGCSEKCPTERTTF